MKPRHAAALARVGWYALIGAAYGVMVEAVCVLLIVAEIGSVSLVLAVALLALHPTAWTHALSLSPAIVTKSNALEDAHPDFFTFAVAPIGWGLIGLVVGIFRALRHHGD
jgi:hypothetical protein